MNNVPTTIRMKVSAKGFTLIEILVAVLIFALMAAASYAAVDVLLRTQIALQQRASALQQLQIGMARFERDIRQAMTRGVQDPYGDPIPALRGSSSTIEITRAGLSNPLDETRARIERVGWALNTRSFTRIQQRTLDRASNNMPIAMPLLDHIARIQFRYFDGEQWRSEWPKPNIDASQRDQLPQAVELIVDSDNFGELRRIVECVENPIPLGRSPAPPALGLPP